MPFYAPRFDADDAAPSDFMLDAALISFRCADYAAISWLYFSHFLSLIVEFHFLKDLASSRRRRRRSSLRYASSCLMLMLMPDDVPAAAIDFSSMLIILIFDAAMISMPLRRR